MSIAKISSLLVISSLLASCGPGYKNFKLSNGGTLKVMPENVSCEGGDSVWCNASGYIEMPSGSKVDWQSFKGCNWENGKIVIGEYDDFSVCNVAKEFNISR